MKQVIVFVEGQTEERFVRDTLNPYFATSTLYLTSISQSGSVKYSQLNKDIRRSLYRHDVVLVTTMLDYYRLQADFPHPITNKRRSLRERVEAVEESWANAIDARKFLPYLACQEFEAMLFADPDAIAQAFPDDNIVSRLQRIRRKFANPEEIDNKMPPSKHILALVGGAYQKHLHGPVIAQKIGLEGIRDACPHFDSWIKQLETLSDASG